MTQTSFGTFGLVSTALNVNQARVLKAAPGAVIAAVVTVAGSTTAGGIYDAATTAGATTGNLIGVLLNSVGPVTIEFPCQTGILVVPGSGQSVSVCYQ